jgi:hypothetical protein
MALLASLSGFRRGTCGRAFVEVIALSPRGESGAIEAWGLKRFKIVTIPGRIPGYARSAALPIKSEQ